MTEPKTFLSQPRILVTQEFIEANKLKLRTQEEIVEKFKQSLAENSFMNFEIEVYLNNLSFKNAKEFLNEEYVKQVEAKEKEFTSVDTVEETTQDFLDYMNFAWGKAEDQRGISASRSIQKLGAWLWLLGREDLEQTIQRDDLYNPYGAPALIEVCNQLNITVPQSLIEFSKIKCE